MEWQVVAKHWKAVEHAAEKALNLIDDELRKKNLSLPFDDNLKQRLLCRTQNG